MKTVRVRLIDHLTTAQLDAAVAASVKELVASSEPITLLVDCTQMRSYDIDARDKFTAWIRAERGRISRVGIVTEKITWHMVVRTMSLMTSLEMKSFSTAETADEWAAGGPVAAV